MKRKNTIETENPDVEVKRGRISNGSDGGHTPPHVHRNGGAAHKCSICLWPVGAPQCYHTSTTMDR